MTKYMLDTNAASAVIQSDPAFQLRMKQKTVASISISAIVEGELRFGLANKTRNRDLEVAVARFLAAVDVLPWGSREAQAYGLLRAELWAAGKSLRPLDTLIAAHALAEQAVLVTADRAFTRAPRLALEDWTQ